MIVDGFDDWAHGTLIAFYYSLLNWSSFLPTQPNIHFKKLIDLMDVAWLSLVVSGKEHIYAGIEFGPSFFLTHLFFLVTCRWDLWIELIELDSFIFGSEWKDSKACVLWLRHSWRKWLGYVFPHKKWKVRLKNRKVTVRWWF